MALLDSSSNRKGLRHTIYRPESPPSPTQTSDGQIQLFENDFLASLNKWEIISKLTGKGIDSEKGSWVERRSSYVVDQLQEIQDYVKEYIHH